jgi:7-cyano-7-deazaguanine reductase
MDLTKLQSTVQSSAPLGQKSPYPKSYDKTLLFPVKRALQREAMGFPADIAFKGFDVWNAYELFWLNHKGKPIRSTATFLVPADSVNIAESKSVKLYLNSLNHEKFSNVDEVAHTIATDLSEVCQSQVNVVIAPTSLNEIVGNQSLKYRCLDELDVAIDHYERTPELLKIHDAAITEQKLVSHLFKSHCLCTGQPDMGSIFIDYVGPLIDEAGLLAYLISYRDHVGFSENCVEQIFVDLTERLQPQKLVVFGRFTRRGGIDINPYRASHEILSHNVRLVYQ